MKWKLKQNLTNEWCSSMHEWKRFFFLKKNEYNIWCLGTNTHAWFDVHINENKTKTTTNIEREKHAQVPSVLQMKTIQSCEEERKISFFFQLMCVIPWNPLRYWLRYQTKSIVVPWICEYALPQFYIHMPMNECYESLLIQHKSMRTSTSHISTCLCGFSVSMHADWCFFVHFYNISISSGYPMILHRTWYHLVMNVGVVIFYYALLIRIIWSDYNAPD